MKFLAAKNRIFFSLKSLIIKKLHNFTIFELIFFKTSKNLPIIFFFPINFLDLPFKIQPIYLR